MSERKVLCQKLRKGRPLSEEIVLHQGGWSFVRVVHREGGPLSRMVLCQRGQSLADGPFVQKGGTFSGSFLRQGCPLSGWSIERVVLCQRGQSFADGPFVQKGGTFSGSFLRQGCPLSEGGPFSGRVIFG